MEMDLNRELVMQESFQSRAPLSEIFFQWICLVEVRQQEVVEQEPLIY
jgi:hypothetical protein